MLDNQEILPRYLDFWQYLNEYEKNVFIENMVNQKYSKGKTLHRNNEDCLGVILLKKGRLRIYLLSEDGKDVTLYRLFTGDVCILSASCILEAITFDIFIDVEENSELITIDSTIFQQVASKNIYVENFGYKLVTKRFSEVMWAMQQILFMAIDKRLAMFLLEESNKRDTLELKVTHEEIAKNISSAREVVTRMLKYFVQEGIVELTRGKITIANKSKLEQMLDK